MSLNNMRDEMLEKIGERLIERVDQKDCSANDIRAAIQWVNAVDKVQGDKPPDPHDIFAQVRNNLQNDGKLDPVDTEEEDAATQ